MKRASAAWVVLTFSVALIGGWIGVRMGQRIPSTNLGLDQVLHHELSLTREQERRIEALEAAFADRRKVYEAEMHAANQALAQAIVTDHRMSPAAEAAISRFHHAMLQLQELTTEHVLGMREVLDAGQAAAFDRAIVRVLAADPQ